ncbi:MAG: GTP-binding protein [Betaproteobacteria bacterium]
MDTALLEIAPDEAQVQTGVLRLITAGSVDDGKSTLIGRLLHDSRAILEDQYAAVARASERRGQEFVDLSLLTDGLEAEREQGITIDVAYRYFATPRRKFIIADTPGHEQYTRNMVTGASTADAAVVLIDARKGLLVQSRRHIYLSALLGLSEIIVAVNKMDLVDFDEAVFRSIRHEVLAFAHGLDVSRVSFVPISALRGDMVVNRGDALDWWTGPTLLEALETVDASRTLLDLPARFPVQLVSRPDTAGLHGARGYLGRLESGTLTRGQAVMVLPSRQSTRIKDVISLEGSTREAIADDSVTLILEDDVDISRGDMVVSLGELPSVTNSLSARLCWLSADAFEPQRSYLLRHTTRTVKARIRTVTSRINIHTLERDAFTAPLAMNDIVNVQIALQQPIACDAYAGNRITGAFILIDEVSNQTVAAGLID